MSCPKDVPSYGCTDQKCARNANGDLIVTATSCGGGLTPISAPFNYDDCIRRGGRMFLNDQGFVCGGFPTTPPPTFPPGCPTDLPKDWLACKPLACTTQPNQVTGKNDIYVQGSNCSTWDPSQKTLNYSRCLDNQRAFSGFGCPSADDLSLSMILLIVFASLAVFCLLASFVIWLRGEPKSSSSSSSSSTGGVEMTGSSSTKAALLAKYMT